MGIFNCGNFVNNPKNPVTLVTMGTRTIAILAAIALLALTVYYGARNWDSWDPEQSQEEREAAVGELTVKLKLLSKQIEIAHGGSTCKRDDQCRIVGLGSRACGEYKDYIIYSTKDADEARLLAVIERFNKAHGEMLKLSLAVADCGVKPAPIGCVRGRCAAIQQ
jgi:hypothetical protein